MEKVVTQIKTLFPDYREGQPFKQWISSYVRAVSKADSSTCELLKQVCREVADEQPQDKGFAPSEACFVEKVDLEFKTMILAATNLFLEKYSAVPLEREQELQRLKDMSEEVKAKTAEAVARFQQCEKELGKLGSSTGVDLNDVSLQLQKKSQQFQREKAGNVAKLSTQIEALKRKERKTKTILLEEIPRYLQGRFSEILGVRRPPQMEISWELIYGKTMPAITVNPEAFKPLLAFRTRNDLLRFSLEKEDLLLKRLTPDALALDGETEVNLGEYSGLSLFRYHKDLEEDEQGILSAAGILVRNQTLLKKKELQRISLQDKAIVAFWETEDSAAIGLASKELLG